jgi:WD repeat-containing protein 26
MEHNEIVTVCRWFPNGQNFISASVDKEVIVWNLLGTVVHQWSLDRMFDLAITPDGSKMVAICNERKLHIYSINDDFREHLSYQMPHNMTSIVASNDSKYVLINSMAQEVHLWDIERFQLVRKFVGQTQEKFMIRSCFGGPDQNFVLSGSEGYLASNVRLSVDSRIYVWNREHGTLIDTIEGHTASCNCVAWNPVEAYMFASAGDDHEIRMYTP